MHFTTTAILAFTLLTTTSLTTGNAKRQAPLLCSGASATPNCCAVNVLNLADLQCADPVVGRREVMRTGKVGRWGIGSGRMHMEMSAYESFGRISKWVV
ncbi:hypothetical protein HO133_009526 [Letharia lupina]|uniref:Hydrophobin n=1 Tax=Letharia lupina TaxID=560253 RepID=A0A8H6CLW4_9LECA|nr:uncharacterized protein HO133_009526 [Letharia lupina]KAF6225526.1 hypothetical protein HO133_009526 [Letharia lupina]